MFIINGFINVNFLTFNKVCRACRVALMEFEHYTTCLPEVEIVEFGHCCAQTVPEI